VGVVAENDKLTDEFGFDQKKLGKRDGGKGI
jgi:hypothetical protein